MCKNERLEPIEQLGSIRPGELNLTNQEHRKAYTDAVKLLNKCPDTLALIQTRLDGNTYGPTRNSFEPGRVD